MQILSTVLFSAASISFGAILGVLRSKIFASKENNKLHYIFYGFSILVGISSIVGFFIYSKMLEPNILLALIAGIVSSILLFLVTNKLLFFKNVFKTKELDPIINKFTSNADKSEIKLFGGDLNFLGKSDSEIDSNAQYVFLKAHQFKKISILCEAPHSAEQRRRYGKILHEMPQIELKFYEPDIADLKVRGRIIQVQGVTKLLMYTKVKSGVYQSIETDTANSNGALYNNIWELVWSSAIKPGANEIKGYISNYRGQEIV